MFELNNDQRLYFGLNPVLPSWEKLNFKGDALRPDSIIYYDGNIIKRHIISTDLKYEESQYNEVTKNKNILLPKTEKGKERKLTPAVLEKCRPIKTYCRIKYDRSIIIGSHTTQRTFYNSEFDNFGETQTDSIRDIVDNYIATCPSKYINEITEFNLADRKNYKYKAGDFFRFKINRKKYGFGRILLDINKIRKQKLIKENHGFFNLFGPAVLIKLYAILSEKKELEIEEIKRHISLPACNIMDNHIFYGDYEIIGNKKLEENELDFPISYGRRNDQNGKDYVYFQWGLIHLELHLTEFSKYLYDDRISLKLNPYKNSAIGFYPSYGTNDIKSALAGNNVYNTSTDWYTKFDLRSPENENIKKEIMIKFGLNPELNYIENSKLANAKNFFEVL
ncbi:immunity 26/phosphotriesterase HocA family protein [Leptospira bandrabouensis]|uniref:immunity 26/phosphotriesterase HocA family protein n=1 Tax=Leptospira bandrabouensis TaxID=2484903 RepID=UPI00223D23A2|nr:immunity 26/phosphotriesterase HocA family protein [Leptospira bandrabouensis]MCW7479445.1 immunity 26/phosphotriesterase HocA family protein [Leptospira bandrabouensis]MCW7487128.1 immunity 26/phosphotriesterase HocA family protein [Leptospira bandrabouensis]